MHDLCNALRYSLFVLHQTKNPTIYLSLYRDIDVYIFVPYKKSPIQNGLTIFCILQNYCKNSVYKCYTIVPFFGFTSATNEFSLLLLHILQNSLKLYVKEIFMSSCVEAIIHFL